MRQLRETGWMHNRLRMIVGSFLVKDLLVDWRVGERHFRHLLVDGDVAQNVGNWQWVAGTGPDASPYHRIFNPVTQSRKFDPGGALHPPMGARAGRPRRPGASTPRGSSARWSWPRPGSPWAPTTPTRSWTMPRPGPRALAAYAAVGQTSPRPPDGGAAVRGGGPPVGPGCGLGLCAAVCTERRAMDRGG